MSNLFLTLVIAFVIIVFAIALLAIGWLITGKTKIHASCGRTPSERQGEECQSCEVCHGPSEAASKKPETSSLPPDTTP